MKKIKGVIDRFEGDKAVIKSADKEIIFPKEELKNFKEGDYVSFLVLTEEEETENSREIAKNLLKEILKEE